MPARRNGVEVEGLRETVKALERVGYAVEDLKGVFGPIAAHAAEIMRPFIPTRSGKLRASARGSKAKNVARVTIGSARVKYAGAINYGWGTKHANYKHGRYASGIRGSFRGVDYTAKTDAALGDDSVRMLETGLQDLLNKEQLT